MGDQAQVEQDSGGHDGDDNGAYPVTDAALLQVAHGAPCGGQTVGAAAAERYPVDVCHRVLGPEQVSVAGAGGGPSDVHARDSPLATEHHGAAGGVGGVGVVAHLKSVDVRQRVVHAIFLPSASSGRCNLTLFAESKKSARRLRDTVSAVTANSSPSRVDGTRSIGGRSLQRQPRMPVVAVLLTADGLSGMV